MTHLVFFHRRGKYGGERVVFYETEQRKVSTRLTTVMSGMGSTCTRMDALCRCTQVCCRCFRMDRVRLWRRGAVAFLAGCSFSFRSIRLLRFPERCILVLQGLVDGRTGVARASALEWNRYGFGRCTSVYQYG